MGRGEGGELLTAAGQGVGGAGGGGVIERDRVWERMCERERDGQMGCHCLTGRHGIFLNSTGDTGLVQNRQENVKYMYSESQGTLLFLQIDK